MCFDSDKQATNGVFENNLLSTCQEFMNVEAGRFAGSGVDYNLYANGPTVAWTCTKSSPNKTFAEWRTCIGGDNHSKTAASAKMNSEGELESGSPAKEAGTNLTSICEAGLSSVPAAETACKENILGEPRPTSGAWNAGAY